jgi:hypothetical protein
MKKIRLIEDEERLIGVIEEESSSSKHALSIVPQAIEAFNRSSLTTKFFLTFLILGVTWLIVGGRTWP